MGEISFSWEREEVERKIPFYFIFPGINLSLSEVDEVSDAIDIKKKSVKERKEKDLRIFILPPFYFAKRIEKSPDVLFSRFVGRFFFEDVYFTVDTG